MNWPAIIAVSLLLVFVGASIWKATRKSTTVIPAGQRPGPRIEEARRKAAASEDGDEQDTEGSEGRERMR